ncbi:MAG: hypothetical protein H7Y89_04585 [Steroidobacteraceae bacterium]|nr:hypothetical protein [Steroidobacteraceae bacterium]
MKMCVLVVTVFAGIASAANYPRVDAILGEFDAHVAQMRAGFAKLPGSAEDKSWVKSKLQHMVDVDQYARKATMSPGGAVSSPEEFAELMGQVSRRAMEVDARNTRELKLLIEKYGWFTIREFDAAADRNAWLLVQHADADPEFQKRVLKVLEPLVKSGGTSPRNFAYLFDRVAVSVQNAEGRKVQRFGTQGQCSGPGTWDPHPVEDPAKLDERRREVGLEPLAEYQRAFKDICKESIEETLRKLGGATGPKVTP